MSLWRRNPWCVAVSFLFFLAFVSAVRINEVELNPEGTDAGKEWIELYSESEIDASMLVIKNFDGQTINLSKFGSFSGFFIINLSSQWLDNSNEKVFLLQNNSVIDETPVLGDSYNDERSWQYCTGNWTFVNSTYNKENLCTKQQTNTDNQTQNNVGNTSETAVSIGLEYEEIKTREFEVKLKSYNLKAGGYDVKVYLEKNGTIISEIYDETDDEWQSGNYYLNSIIFGEGDKTENLMLRIDIRFLNVKNAEIKAKIRKTGTSSIIAEASGEVKIARENAIIQDTNQGNFTIVENENNNIENISVIKLNNPENIESSKTWKSKSEYIKQYALYGFALFCIFVIVILVIKKTKGTTH